jgi:hypothetical protein
LAEWKKLLFYDHFSVYGRNLLALSDDGRLVGFGRQHIVLQLYKDHQPVGFLG